MLATGASLEEPLTRLVATASVNRIGDSLGSDVPIRNASSWSASVPGVMVTVEGMARSRRAAVQYNPRWPAVARSAPLYRPPSSSRSNTTSGEVAGVRRSPTLIESTNRLRS